VGADELRGKGLAPPLRGTSHRLEDRPIHQRLNASLAAGALAKEATVYRFSNFFCNAAQNFSEEWIKDNKFMKTKILRNTLAAVNLLAALSILVCAAAQGQSGTAAPNHHTYTLIDLGTFGGPTSYNYSANARAMNAQGAVDGLADTARSTWAPAPSSR
jgi:hypothetical protein